MKSGNTATGGTTKYKRRCYVINAAFQWKYTLTLAIGVFLVASTMGIALFGFLHEQARDRMIHPEVVSIWQNTRVIFFFALAFSGVVVSSLVFWGIMITHRVSGPLFVLDRGLRALTAGRMPQRRTLRKKDEFKGLYETFWVYVDSLVAQRKADAAKLDELLAAAQRASANAAGDDKSALTNVAHEMAQMRDELAAFLDQDSNAPKSPTDADASESAVCESVDHVEATEPAECSV